MYRDQFGEFACGYWGLKGYNPDGVQGGYQYYWFSYFFPIF